MGKSGGPGRDRTDDLFHATAEKQPEICFQVVRNWDIGRKPVDWAMFPANFRQTLTLSRAAWAGSLVRLCKWAISQPLRLPL
jgi:hypothetical protein